MVPFLQEASVILKNDELKNYPMSYLKLATFGVSLL